MTDREAAERIVDSLLDDHFEGRTKDALCRAVLPRLGERARPSAKLYRQVERILRRLERAGWAYFDRRSWRWRLAGPYQSRQARLALIARGAGDRA